MSETKSEHANYAADRDLYSGLIRLHVLHHAAKEGIFGLGMIEELARHGYQISPGSLWPYLNLKSKTPDRSRACFFEACPPCPLSRRLGSMELLTPDEIGRLTPPERLALIAQLWDSLEHEQLPLTSAPEEELEHRLTSLDEDRRNGVTWGSLKAELEQRCR
jgi:putative addiction module component (TIGR02574 family)